MPVMRACCLLLLFAAFRLSGQQGEVFQIERLGTQDGISHRWSTCVHQDAYGVFWIGTYDGLNRYDGNDFITYRPSAGGKFPVVADLIQQVVEMDEGHFFLSTANGFLRFDPETGIFEAIPLLNRRTPMLLLLPGKGKKTLVGNLALWSPDLPLEVYEWLPSGKTSLLAKLSAENSSNLVPVQIDRRAAWFWDFDGTYHCFDLNKKAWRRFPIAGSKDCPVDAHGNLWLPDGARLRSFSMPNLQQEVRWNTFSIERDQAVWLYALGKNNDFSLYRFDLRNGSLKAAIPAMEDAEFLHYRLLIPYHQTQLLDREGTTWFTGFLGLYKIKSTGKLFRQYLSRPVRRIEAPPSGISAREMVEDAFGNIYLRSAEAEVYKINPETGLTQKLRLPPVQPRNDEIYRELQKIAEEGIGRLPMDRVFSIAGDADGSIWMRSPLALFRYDPATEQFEQYYLPTLATPLIFTDHQNRVWSIDAQETHFLDKTTKKITRTQKVKQGGSYTGKLCYSVMIPEENTIWDFTDTGLVNINTSSLQSRNIRLYDEPREQRCLVAHRGWLWIGTSKGLEKVDPHTFARTNYDRSKGLPANFIYTMVADGDYLWLGTADGLCRFHVETGEVKNFYVEDGLSHYEFNSLSAFKARNGRIYMGGLNGVNSFFPEELEQKTTVGSNIHLSRFSLYEKNADSLIFLSPKTLGQEIVLQPSVSSFNLYLALTSYLDPSKNQYAWRMGGLDADWFYAGNQHIATYRYIPPGSYTFRAKAADSFGNWSQNELTIKIRVLRPWYYRWWAWLIYLLALAGAAFALYRFQLSKKMEQAEKRRLQELDTFKNRFFTNITHEFRTPLTVILGMSEQLAGEVKGEAKNMIGLISRNGQNLLRLINQLLDLAKLESDNLSMNYVQGDVLPYLRYITESLQSFANAQNVVLRVENREGEIVIDYEPDRLQQIVYNLLSNAIKFTPSGGQVSLRVNVGQSRLDLSVVDNGVGIPQEDLPYIFDRFYQGRNLEKAKTGGTGIGLSLTRELVKAMGGSISVESEPGQGTAFSVSLPISHKAPKTQWASSGTVVFSSGLREKTVQGIFPGDSKRPSLLIIEDNPDLVEYLNACLKDRYQLNFAYNGRSGIEKALEISPDLVLSDVMMPEKDGLEVCDTLKSDERSSHIPIVLLTAKADVESRISGLRRGADAYLAKPFNREELLANLHNLLESRRKLQKKYASAALNPELVAAALPDEDYDTENLENEFLHKLRSIVEAKLSDPNLSVAVICREIGMGRTNLHNKLSALTGLSITIYVRKLRLQRAKELLYRTDMNIAEIAYQVGFGDPKFFSRVFTEEFGAPPSEYRRN